MKHGLFASLLACALVGSAALLGRDADPTTFPSTGPTTREALSPNIRPPARPGPRPIPQIRKAIVGDKTLSTYAHNVKVISQNGTVTLKGPVRSDAEMKSILAKAQDMAGADRVVNEMAVQPENQSK